MIVFLGMNFSIKIDIFSSVFFFWARLVTTMNRYLSFMQFLNFLSKSSANQWMEEVNLKILLIKNFPFLGKFFLKRLFRVDD